jgi:hypothetical protein
MVRGAEANVARRTFGGGGWLFLEKIIYDIPRVGKAMEDLSVEQL